tara:strand:+ start:824 stop:2974 length:2151 start_codon:yes stop_codon:yes gene_type:complete
MSVLNGMKLVQIGGGLAAAVCGRLFADVGADVVAIDAAGDTPLAQHLNAEKTPVSAISSDADLIVVEGAPGHLKQLGRDEKSLRELAPDTPLIFISPYGQAGPDADKPADDLTLFCASGIARCLTGQVDDLSEAPIRPVGRQSAFIGGLAAACAGMHAALKGGPITVDVSIQEALATLSMTELARAGLGGAGWSRKRLTDGNGATVCILPAKDGYAAISPREDHQWAAWLEAIGSPAWGNNPRFRTKPDRVQNWDELHALMAEWSRNHDKQAISDMAQEAHVPSFPLREPKEQLASPQLAERNSLAIRNINDNPLTIIKNPFRVTHVNGNPAPLPSDHGDLPLAGVRVLDFSWVIAGPTTTRYLAAMGAEVIKVEAPGRGDPGRASELHTVLGQEKQGIVLNLKHNDAKRIARDLAARSDILIENFATGVMDRLGLGPDTLQSANPNLIYISASGMGRTGPEAKAVAYGTLLQCYAGFAGLNRHPEVAPRVGMAWLDPMCGLKLAFMVAAALWYRQSAGGGSRVDFSMIEAMLWTMAEPLIEAQTATPPTPKGNRSRTRAPHGIYRCQGEDNWIGLSVSNSEQWANLCDLINELAPYRRSEFADRIVHAEDINAILDIFISKQNAGALAERLTGLGIAAAALSSTTDLSENGHLQARGFWDPVEGGALPGLPWRSNLGRRNGPAPKLGEHTETVLQNVLGLSEAEVAALRSDGTFG